MSNNTNKRAPLYTRSGVLMDLTDPKVEDINIFDIVNGMKSETRFSGQYGFTVYDHCMLCVYLLPDSTSLDKVLATFLHDATEAYIRDLNGPLKKLLPGYMDVESKLNEVIYKRFGLTYLLDDSVTAADIKAVDIMAYQLELYKTFVIDANKPFSSVMPLMVGSIKSTFTDTHNLDESFCERFWAKNNWIDIREGSLGRLSRALSESQGRQ